MLLWGLVNQSMNLNHHLLPPSLVKMGKPSKAFLYLAVSPSPLKRQWTRLDYILDYIYLRQLFLKIYLIHCEYGFQLVLYNKEHGLQDKHTP